MPQQSKRVHGDRTVGFIVNAAPLLAIAFSDADRKSHNDLRHHTSLKSERAGRTEVLLPSQFEREDAERRLVRFSCYSNPGAPSGPKGCPFVRMTFPLLSNLAG